MGEWHRKALNEQLDITADLRAQLAEAKAESAALHDDFDDLERDNAQHVTTMGEFADKLACSQREVERLTAELVALREAAEDVIVRIEAWEAGVRKVIHRDVNHGMDLTALRAALDGQGKPDDT